MRLGVIGGILAALSSPAMSCAPVNAVCFESLGAQDGYLDGGGSADGSVGAGSIAVSLHSVPYIAYGISSGTTLPMLPGHTTGSAVAVNNSHYAAGSSYNDNAQQAVRWDNSGVAAGLGFLQNQNASYATGMSDDANVVVGNSYVYPTAPTSLAFRWVNDIHGGTMTSLGTLPGDSFSDATAVSRDGAVVVGVSTSIDSNTSNFIVRPFRWMSGNMIAIAGASANGLPKAVTDDGSVILFNQGERWVNGVVTATGLTSARAMSADGSVVGGFSNEAARWTARDGVKSIKNLLIAHGNTDAAGWTLQEVTGVSADGKQFVGIGLDPSGQHYRGWTARLPLPSAPHDFDGDGKSDIFWRNTGGSNALWQMNGATVSSVALLGGVDTSWAVVGQRDFDGDGKTDILWRNSGGSNAIWFMNGATVTSVSLIGGVATNWSVVGTADLDGDGRGDIIWRNTDGAVAVWLMNGATVSSVAILGSVGINWSIVGTADVNGDGKGDILWRDTSGNIVMWLMNGVSASSVANLGNIGTNWSIAGTADFDGDGKGDILWREAGGSNAIWLMNGTSVASVALIGGVATNWSVASNGDYNGDGKGDILWREAGGSNAIWTMNGTSISSVTLTGGVASNWAVQNAGAN